MHYVYAVQNEYGEFLRIGECKNLKTRLSNYVTKPYKNKGGKSLMSGQFYGQNIELIVLRECETKDEGKKWEGIFKQLLGFEWTEKTRIKEKTRLLGNQRNKELYSQPVLAFRANTGELVGEYYSQNEAGKQLGLHGGTISKVIRGIVKSTGGYTFQEAV